MKKIDHFTDFIRRKTGVLRIEIKNKINIRVKMGELFRSLYPCEDEIELQKAEFNICYLSKDEKEVENGNLVGIGEYSLTGNQVIAGIPILATAASGYKLEGKESRIEDEMRMMANTIFLYWRDEKEWALMTRGIAAI